MTFVDTLRSARDSRVAVLHEFWTQFNPHQLRVHAFFEGHDDIAFFAPHIERRLPPDYRLLTHRCEGKSRVFEAFTEITKRRPDIRLVLFFVDKDLDDVLGRAWPTDPRIFVTDVYSVENYIVNADVLLRLYRDAVRLRDVTFDEAVITGQFEEQLIRYQRRLLTVMAWILLTKRAGGQPNLNNVDLGAMWHFTDRGDIRPLLGCRMQILTRSTGVKRRAPSFGRLRDIVRELERMPSKRVLRGKYEVWFLVEYWKHLVAHLGALATEAGGRLSVKVTLSHSNVVPALASYVDTPHALELFLRAHLTGPTITNRAVSNEPPERHWWKRLAAAVARWRSQP